MSEAKINEKGILPILMDEIDDFEKEVESFVKGEWDPNAFMAFRLKQGVYGQRQPDSQMFRVKIPVGGAGRRPAGGPGRHRTETSRPFRRATPPPVRTSSSTSCPLSARRRPCASSARWACRPARPAATRCAT